MPNHTHTHRLDWFNSNNSPFNQFLSFIVHADLSFLSVLHEWLLEFDVPHSPSLSLPPFLHAIRNYSVNVAYHQSSLTFKATSQTIFGKTFFFCVLYNFPLQFHHFLCVNNSSYIPFRMPYLHTHACVSCENEFLSDSNEFKWKYTSLFWWQQQLNTISGMKYSFCRDFFLWIV